MSSDNAHPLSLPADTQSSSNHRDVMKLLWGFMEPYFKKYNLAYAGAYNNLQADGPTITWSVYSRVPGNARGVAQSRGPTHSALFEADADGTLKEELIQFHTVVYEFRVGAANSAEADEIAWDLENYIRIASGSVAERVHGFTINFQEEMADRTAGRQQQDDVLYRTLRFIAQVPVYFNKYHHELRTIRQLMAVGRSLVQSGRLTRTSASTRYDIEVNSNQWVVGIVAVYRFNADGTTTHLHEDVDYTVEKDPETLGLYIEWNDDFGIVPAVDQDFRVDYSLAYLKSAYQVK